MITAHWQGLHLGTSDSAQCFLRYVSVVALIAFANLDLINIGICRKIDARILVGSYAYRPTLLICNISVSIDTLCSNHVWWTLIVPLSDLLIAQKDSITVSQRQLNGGSHTAVYTTTPAQLLSIPDWLIFFFVFFVFPQLGRWHVGMKDTLILASDAIGSAIV